MKCELYIEWNGGRIEHNKEILENYDVMVLCALLLMKAPVTLDAKTNTVITKPSKIYATQRIVDMIKNQAERDKNVLVSNKNGLSFRGTPIVVIDGK